MNKDETPEIITVSFRTPKLLFKRFEVFCDKYKFTPEQYINSCLMRYYPTDDEPFEDMMDPAFEASQEELREFMRKNGLTVTIP